jgi:hypothetical protein
MIREAERRASWNAMHIPMTPAPAMTMSAVSLVILQASRGAADVQSSEVIA